METIRDTAFGKLVRLFSRQRWMRYPEEQDVSIWPEFLKTETDAKEEGERTTSLENPEDLETFGLYTVTSQAATRARRVSSSSTLRESGQALVISWRGHDDSEVGFLLIFICLLHSLLCGSRGANLFYFWFTKNPQNWSIKKKTFVSCLIWLLTFAIYIGSAIYTPGIPGVATQFGVSNVAATLGLTLFVLGYGLGSY
jgi:DHA1 family multidrug resistance protein-like MFS transporter